MPFTFAHPAAVLPLARFGHFLPFSALVIGSLSPDLPYFLLTQTPFHHYGHTALGLLTFDLPVGYLLFVLWHRILEAPVVALLPEQIRERLAGTAATPAKSFRLHFILAALLVGALTHLVWDSATHEDGWIVERVPALTHSVFNSVPLYGVLQYGSTLLGLLVLGRAFFHYLQRLPPAPEETPPLPSPRSRHLVLLGLFMLAPLCGTAYTVAYHRTRGHGEPMKKVLADGTEATTTLAFLTLTAYAVSHQRKEIS